MAIDPDETQGNESFEELENIGRASQRGWEGFEFVRYQLEGGTLDQERCKILVKALELKRSDLKRKGLSDPEVELCVRYAESEASAWLERHSLESLRSVFPREMLLKSHSSSMSGWPRDLMKAMGMIQDRLVPPVPRSQRMPAVAPEPAQPPEQLLSTYRDGLVIREAWSRSGLRFYACDEADGEEWEVPISDLRFGEFVRQDENGAHRGYTVVGKKGEVIHLELNRSPVSETEIHERYAARAPSTEMMAAIRKRLLERVLRNEEGKAGNASETAARMKRLEASVDDYLAKCGATKLNSLQVEELRLQAKERE
jgi:hypothetical protein